ncbi:MAG: hypothetical protein K2Z81_04760 [Cyanobacteria bacterium]|nr:hypothetical protein [Cyanobacteriota bacterium]
MIELNHAMSTGLEAQIVFNLLKEQEEQQQVLDFGETELLYQSNAGRSPDAYQRGKGEQHRPTNMVSSTIETVYFSEPTTLQKKQSKGAETDARAPQQTYPEHQLLSRFQSVIDSVGTSASSAVAVKKVGTEFLKMYGFEKLFEAARCSSAQE